MTTIRQNAEEVDKMVSPLFQHYEKHVRNSLLCASNLFWGRQGICGAFQQLEDNTTFHPLGGLPCSFTQYEAASIKMAVFYLINKAAMEAGATGINFNVFSGISQCWSSSCLAIKGDPISNLPPDFVPFVDELFRRGASAPFIEHKEKFSSPKPKSEAESKKEPKDDHKDDRAAKTAMSFEELKEEMQKLKAKSKAMERVLRMTLDWIGVPEATMEEVAHSKSLYSNYAWLPPLIFSNSGHHTFNNQYRGMLGLNRDGRDGRNREEGTAAENRDRERQGAR